ncbi:MAG: 16S/23S rRNA (cytidine-2'-O)-methyltransferase [Candidatus Dormibacteraeota bacterium]|nr:16S/23S rRNA (cytidine-2'-O)-methyltransferase [Candidatus Dormibacteraeota bacterium]
MPRVRKRKLRDEVLRRWPELEPAIDELIETGKVSVDGLPRTNLRTAVSEGASIRVERTPRRFRGYEKLSQALDLLGISAEGVIAIDAGAAAGGFTQVLLDRGAARVYAVEVGYGQLLGSLRQDPRVVNLERTNVGALTTALVPDPISAVTLDLGYLALAKGVPQLNAVTFAPGAWLAALVKPMSELGTGELPLDDGAVDDATERAAQAIAGAGWRVVRTIRSPVRGTHGAIEAFVHGVRDG